MEMMEVIEGKTFDNKNDSNAFEEYVPTGSSNIKTSPKIGCRSEALKYEGRSPRSLETQDDEIPPDNRTTQLSTSKWTNLARALRFGPSFDSAIPQHVNDSSMNTTQSLNSAGKRGSLGNVFRHGFNLNSRSYSIPPPQEPAANETSSLHNKRGALWKMFKLGKSSQSLNEPNLISSETEDPNTTSSSKRQSLGRLLKGKKYSESKSCEVSNAEASENDVLPPPELRGRSLGKYFRSTKDFHAPEFLGNVLKRPLKKKDKVIPTRTAPDRASSSTQPSEEDEDDIAPEM